MAFSVFVITQMLLAMAFSASRERSLLKTGLFKNRWLWLSIGFGAAAQVLITEWRPLQAVFGTVSLALTDWLVVLTVAAVAGVVPEGAKLARHARTGLESGV